MNIELVLKISYKYKHINEVNEYINVCAESQLKIISITNPLPKISSEFIRVTPYTSKFCRIHVLNSRQKRPLLTFLSKLQALKILFYSPILTSTTKM